MHVTPWLLLLGAGARAGRLRLGNGIIVCALHRYRDLAVVVSFATQSLMYVTPVIYPVSAIPARYRCRAGESAQSGVRGTAACSATAFGDAAFAASALSMLVVLAIGLLLFTRADRTFMDTI
jgi:lipopolysaccharide transport system permease protein